MGVCETTNKEEMIETQKSNQEDIKPESMQPNSEMHRLDKSIINVAKSLCKIYAQGKVSSGFLIKFFKRAQHFFCLMTCEHVINTKMIKQQETINIFYDNENETREIKLNPDERFIKVFTEFEMDATVVEILPKDNISKDYFLLTLLDYMDNFDTLIGKEIAIIQYPKGELNLSKTNLVFDIYYFILKV